MRSTTIISLALSILLAIAAVFGVREYLSEQSSRFAAQKEAPQNTIVVAAQPMRFGRLIEPSGLKVIDWPAATLPEGAFKTIDEIIGDSGKSRYVMASIEKDEPVLASKITGAGQRASLSTALDPGMKAVSIRVNDVLGVAGFVLPGDRVDIMLTRSDKAVGTFTDVLLQGVKVLAIDQIADDTVDKPAVVRTVTFEVSTQEAQKLTLAATVGTLSLALRNVSSAETEEIEPVNVNDLGGGTTSRALLEEQLRAAQEARLKELENKVRQVDESVEERMKRLQREMQKEAEVATEEPKPAEIEPPTAALPPVNPFASVGVYRGAGRTEYKVKKTE